MQSILLLHGAIGASDQLLPLKENLSESFIVHTLDFSGHGGQQFSDEPFSIAHFAQDVLHYIDKKGIKKVDIFGYSMGGYVALYLARYFPDRVGKVVTLASKFHWDEPTAERESKMMNVEIIKKKIPSFADTLAKRHAPNNWEEVLAKTKDMLQELGRNNTLTVDDYKNINNLVLIMIGDRDKMITLEETVNVFNALPNARMSMLPNTQHPIEQVNIDFLVFAIKNHFA